MSSTILGRADPVRSPFGQRAGLAAALALAVMPVTIGAERNNTMDGLLVFVLLLAAWAMAQAVTRRQMSAAPASQAVQGGNLMDELGPAGAARLFTEPLASQASWLLPLAILGLVSAVARLGQPWPLTP